MQDVGHLSAGLSSSPDTPGKKDRNSRKQCPYCNKGTIVDLVTGGGGSEQDIEVTHTKVRFLLSLTFQEVNYWAIVLNRVQIPWQVFQRVIGSHMKMDSLTRRG
jgi:hypothetical protein